MARSVRGMAVVSAVHGHSHGIGFYCMVTAFSGSAVTMRYYHEMAWIGRGAHGRLWTARFGFPIFFNPLWITMDHPGQAVGGADRNRTGVHGFAVRCVATPPPRRIMTCRKPIEAMRAGGQAAFSATGFGPAGHHGARSYGKIAVLPLR